MTALGPTPGSSEVERPSTHALGVLEFQKVLERVGERAASELGRRKIHTLRPLQDRTRVAAELGRVGALMRFIDERTEWSMPAAPDVTEVCARLSVEGALLEPVELRALALVMEISSRVRGQLSDGSDWADPEGVLSTLVARLPELDELRAEIEQAVDEDGQVRDRASPDLRRIRSRLRGAHGRVVKLLERFMGGLSERIVLPDASVTLRDGRYVVPIRREGRREVGGIVHDESQTGATLYVEPPVAVEAMNEVRDLEREEKREVRRVLARLTDRVAEESGPLTDGVEALAEIDGLQARARTAAAWRASVPELMDRPADGIRLRGARHPLLVEAHGLEGVVPFDLELAPGERAVVVSGPNTGGKSVFLKATGLAAALVQSGVIPPLGPGTRLPVFRTFHADIGDEQSIDRSLSTFSAHLDNLATILGSADEEALVLIDEMGTGTDPAEGAALARAVLEQLVEAGALTVASSHLGALKSLDGPGSGVVNASLQFDADRMEPTYHLIKGRTGRSYGLAIARSLGFPGAVLDRADGYRDQGEARLEETLARLEVREAESRRILEELEEERARTAELTRELARRERRLAEAEAAHRANAKAEARQLLLDARAEVEEVVQELREAGGRGETLDDAVHEARAHIERAARQRRDDRPDREARRTAVETPVEAGMRVKLRSTGARGRVVELRTDRALVEIGAVKLEAAVGDLEPVGESERSETRSGVGTRWTGADAPPARIEIDLRGLRVEELEIQLARALDDAVREDLPELRIIHGKGTGALRRRVREMLDGDPRVRSARMGAPTEGGAGVTVAGFGGDS